MHLREDGRTKSEYSCAYQKGECNKGHLECVNEKGGYKKRDGGTLEKYDYAESSCESAYRRDRETAYKTIR